MRAFGGNFGMHVRAYTYIRSNGAEGLRDDQRRCRAGCELPSRSACRCLDLPYDRICKHEVVFSGRRQKRTSGVSTLDIAKAILDHGIHPPTIYFPLIVEEALMIEPTETESLETLDRFVDVMHEIAERAVTDPVALKAAPVTTPVGRLDEGCGARDLERASNGELYRPDGDLAGRLAYPSCAIDTEPCSSHVPCSTGSRKGSVQRIESGDLDHLKEFFNTYKRAASMTRWRSTATDFSPRRSSRNRFVKA